MLHVKKENNKVTYLFAKKEKGGRRELALAALLALFIHIICFALFRISAFAYESLPPLPPLQVEVFSPPLKHLPRNFPLDITDRPKDLSCMQKIPDFSPSRKPLLHPDFSSIEAIDYETLNIEF